MVSPSVTDATSTTKSTSTAVVVGDVNFTSVVRVGLVMGEVFGSDSSREAWQLLPTNPITTKKVGRTSRG